jgi:NAD dependent epimerase/dehydratase family enzyme
MVGEAAELVTTGQRVIPKQAQELGYRFQYPASESALREILGN